VRGSAIRIPAGREFQVSLVDERGRLQRVTGAFLAHLALRDAPQFTVYERQQFIERGAVAATPIGKQLSDFLRRHLGHRAKFCHTQPVDSQDSRAADEAVMRENVKQMETGWNTKSGALFAKPFAEDADYVVINGTYIKGRAAIEVGHQRIFDTIFKDTTITLTVKQIRFLRADVAVVHVSGQRVGPTKDLVEDAMMTVMMTKEKQGWTIAAFQNTSVAPKG
jgi:uncharacterized protein (TIGR02246 family)